MIMNDAKMVARFHDNSTHMVVSSVVCWELH